MWLSYELNLIDRNMLGPAFLSFEYSISVFIFSIMKMIEMIYEGRKFKECFLLLIATMLMILSWVLESYNFFEDENIHC